MTDTPPEAHTDEEPLSIDDQVVEQQAAMAPIVEGFLAATADYLRVWIWEETDDIIDSDPDQVVELGARKLKRLRKSVATIDKNMPKLVKRYVGAEPIWVHMASDAVAAMGAGAGKHYKNPYRVTDHHPPPLLARPIDRVTGQLGKLMLKRDLASTRWSKSKSVAGLLDYHRKMTISEDMENSLEQYADAADRLWELTNELAAARTARTVQEAEYLWETVGPDREQAPEDPAGEAE